MNFEPHVNTAWDRTIARELVSLGVRQAVVSPGTRSAAMVSALRDCGTIDLFVQTDERSAAFFALGLTRSTGRPVAICVTSGSAVANLLPALTEAYAQGLPLVALSCDRPKHLRNKGLPQMTKQVEFTAPVVVCCLDLKDPTHDPDELRALGAAVAGLARHLSPGPLQGPVQVNIPQAGRLTSTDGIHGWTEERQIPAEPKPAAARDETARPDLRALDTLDLRPGLKGLIVGGPDRLVSADLVRTLVEVTRFPLLADAPGSLRGLGISGTIAEADFLVTRAEFLRSKPDLIIRLGSVPVSSTMQQFLADAAARVRADAPTTRVLRIDQRSVAGDFVSADFHQLVDPDAATVLALAQRLAPGDEAWREVWIAAAKRCRDRLTRVTEQVHWSEIQAVADALAFRDWDFIHVANSLSLRIVNFMLPASGSGGLVYANRGVSGIDGTFGTFLGEAAGRGGAAGLLILGDLAALHDIAALEACLHGSYRGVILILNNQGAGLFDLLPVRTLPDYERLIRNRTPVDFGLIAGAFGLNHTRCADREAFKTAFRDPERQTALHVIEAMIPPRAAATNLPQMIHQLAQ